VLGQPRNAPIDGGAGIARLPGRLGRHGRGRRPARRSWHAGGADARRDLDVTGTAALDARLDTVRDHAARLRSGAYAPGMPTALPAQWPAPPPPLGPVAYRKIATATALIALVVGGPHIWGAAEVAFGRPPRPTLVGHPTGTQPQGRPAPGLGVAP
jgi:hypothetical protein